MPHIFLASVELINYVMRIHLDVSHHTYNAHPQISFQDSFGLWKAYLSHVA